MTIVVKETERHMHIHFWRFHSLLVSLHVMESFCANDRILQLLLPSMNSWYAFSTHMCRHGELIVQVHQTLIHFKAFWCDLISSWPEMTVCMILNNMGLTSIILMNNDASHRYDQNGDFTNLYATCSLHTCQNEWDITTIFHGHTLPLLHNRCYFINNFLPM